MLLTSSVLGCNVEGSASTRSKNEVGEAVDSVDSISDDARPGGGDAEAISSSISLVDLSEER
jgi:hypothetical protein